MVQGPYTVKNSEKIGFQKEKLFQRDLFAERDFKKKENFNKNDDTSTKLKPILQEQGKD